MSSSSRLPTKPTPVPGVPASARTLAATDGLSIGELARRCGVATSAIRYYEAEGLLQAQRNSAGRRRFVRADLRRLAFILAAQTVGLTLAQIRTALASLPASRTPTPADWEQLSSHWQGQLEARIQAMVRLRDQLGSCIGCGCLSLKHCALFNAQDAAGAKGPGARYLMGDPVVTGDPAASQPVPVKPRASSPRSSAARRAKPE